MGGARAKRKLPVEKVKVSDNVQKKSDKKRTPDGFAEHSFNTLLANLASLILNEVTFYDQPNNPFLLTTDPTRLQNKMFNLLKIRPETRVYRILTV